MPKMKTHKGIKKRVKKTSTGKLKRSKAFRRHIMTKKSGQRKRDLRKGGLIDKTIEKKYRDLI
ncbi:50S ribosomal protein L35 [Natronospora cellulosivora (SeqCode)]